VSGLVVGLSLAGPSAALADSLQSPTPTAPVAGASRAGGSVTGTGVEPAPGPATGVPTVAPPAHVPGAGRKLAVSRPTAAAPVASSSLAAMGSLTAPAVAPSGTGWITSLAWNTAPRAGAATAAMPVFARDVVLTRSVTSATLTIAGLGLYTPTVNGIPASSAVLQPGPSGFSKSVEYRSYDVTGLLGLGSNRLGVQLGTGIYDEVSLPHRYSKLTHIGGPLGFTARLDLKFADGTTTIVDTSSNWWTRPGGTTASDWYGGESYDAATAPTGWQDAGVPLSTTTGWAPAVVANISPQLRLYPQADPAVTAGAPVPAASVWKLSSGDWVVDFGKYVTGQPQLSLAAPTGRVVRMYPAERLAGGEPDQSTSTGNNPNPIYDQYTFAGHGTETWHPQFDYHGFRYLRVTGAADLTLTPGEFVVIPVKTDLPGAGSFSSSSDMLNSLVAMTNTSIDANLQAVLTDCPNREKLGWLEQDWLLFGLLSGRYDMSTYAPNMVRLMVETQRTDGSMAEISPEIVRFGAPFDDDVNWGGALIMLPWELYRTYGDTATMSSSYTAMARYVHFLQSKASGNLLSFGLGDWITTARGASRYETTSMGYYGVVSTMAKIATALGKTSDASSYTTLAGQIKSAINTAYYRNNMYGSEQATNAMALVLGLAPNVQAVRGSLISLMQTWGTHFNTGEIGLGYIFTALHDMGRDDLLWAAISQPDAPGYDYFVSSGAPALPEYWSGMAGDGSLAHFILGYPAEWAQDGLAGIDQADGSVGYQHLLIRPAVFTGPDTVSATRTTVRGVVTVQWTRANESAHVTVTVPAGDQATVVLPGGTYSTPAGTSSFNTGLGTRSDYGSKPFYVPTGTITRVPWNLALWAAVNGVQTQLIYAQWQATGFRASVTGLPAGSVVAYGPVGPDLFAWTSDGQVHKLTYGQWRQIGHPTPVRVARMVTKYQWSSSVWLTTKWKAAPAAWTITHLTYSGYLALGAPRPIDTVVTPHSLVFKHSGSSTIYVKDPGGNIHALTYAEWGHLGYPAPTLA